jgi:hypothetical protein
MTDTENKLNFPTPIKVKPSISKYLDTLEEQGKTIWNFAGTDFIETLFYLHLLNKYKLYCFPSGKHLILPGNRPVGLFISLKQKYSKEEEDEFKQEFNAIADNIVNCVKRGEKMIMIPLCYKKLMSGHANILIYRVNENIIEHYEPHGGEFMSDKKAQDSIKQVLSFFTNILNNKLKVNNAGPVRYVEASQVCPYIQGMQSIEGSSRLPKKAIEPKGYCAAWSLFFIGSPKTRKNKYILPEAIKQQIGDDEKAKALETLIKQQKIDINTKEGQQKLLGILSMFGKK